MNRVCKPLIINSSTFSRFRGALRDLNRGVLTLILSPGGGEETRSKFMAPMCVRWLEVEATLKPASSSRDRRWPLHSASPLLVIGISSFFGHSSLVIFRCLSLLVVSSSESSFHH